MAFIGWQVQSDTSGNIVVNRFSCYAKQNRCVIEKRCAGNLFLSNMSMVQRNYETVKNNVFQNKV